MKAYFSDESRRQTLSVRASKWFADPQRKHQWIERLQQARGAHSPHQTQPEQLFTAICDALRLPFRYTGNGTFWIDDINPDFVDSNGRRVAIDIFGDYWHTPLFRKEALRPNFTEHIRKQIAKKHGWHLIIFWASELRRADAKERVLKALGRKYGGV
mgnify:CR=1 FL=1